MGKIIATVPILYQGRQYIPGEEIHCEDAAMREAWQRAESVREETGMPEVAPVQRRKAVKASAEAGIPVEGSEEEELLGKIPKTAERKKK